ncbi:RloB family protein [Tannockella kyphosi]|uniref:RloB family protein n=1 Tax=Tannockella kyphosi TaxID=2899121 RepID=UPI002012F538|nr:RloB family protein [Tannockella kyphosi]
MAPLKTYSNWFVRSDDNKEQIEPFKSYYIICEGQNTEKWYFESLIDRKRELGIHASIDIKYLEKTKEDKDLSHPIKLMELANKFKENNNRQFDKNHDEMIIVFDADIYEENKERYDSLIKEASKDNILAITNPGFELFLLLHIENSLDEIIVPHEQEIVSNQKVGNQRFIAHLFRKTTGMNAKKNSRISELSKDIQIAINQEKNINNDITKTNGKLTSNVAKVISDILNDQVEF